MKHDNLIIDISSKREPIQRFITSSSTTIIWGVWFWLCRLPLVAHDIFYGLLHLRIFIFAVPDVIEDPMKALLSTTSMLLLWQQLPFSPPKREPLNNTECAKHFGIDEEHLDSVKNKQICTVHHDDDGKITRIE